MANHKTGPFLSTLGAFNRAHLCFTVGRAHYAFRSSQILNKILIIIAGLLVTLVAAVLIVPGFMNWNQYRGMIQTEAAAATGRPGW